MKLSFAVLALSLTGCGLCPTKIVEVPVEVRVPIPVKCKVKKPTPPVPVTALPIPPGLYARTVLLLQEGDAYRLYAKELEAVLGACAVDSDSH